MNNDRYELTEEWVEKVANMLEFANGATQVTVVTNSNGKYERVLISNCTYIIAIDGYESMPFDISGIKEIYQTEKDKDLHIERHWNIWSDFSRNISVGRNTS